MTSLRFSIRDLLWAMVVVAMAVGWWQDRVQHSREISIMRHELRATEGRLIAVQSYMRTRGVSIEVLANGDVLFGDLPTAHTAGSNKP